MATLGPKRGNTKLRVITDRVADLRAAMQVLVSQEVLVGFPEDTTDRDDEDPTEGITNAALGYIHDTGMPEQNIPARPFMDPGIRDNKDKIATALVSVAKGAVSKGTAQHAMKGLHRVGIIAATGLKRKLNEGIPPPLAESTLQERARRGRKGAKKELERRAAGEAASTEFAKPLIDTGQLRNALSYVIRKRKKRR